MFDVCKELVLIFKIYEVFSFQPLSVKLGVTAIYGDFLSPFFFAQNLS